MVSLAAVCNGKKGTSSLDAHLRSKPFFLLLMHFNFFFNCTLCSLLAQLWVSFNSILRVPKVQFHRVNLLLKKVREKYRTHKFGRSTLYASFHCYRHIQHHASGTLVLPSTTSIQCLKKYQVNVHGQSPVCALKDDWRSSFSHSKRCWDQRRASSEWRALKYGPSRKAIYIDKVNVAFPYSISRGLFLVQHPQEKKCALTQKHKGCFITTRSTEAVVRKKIMK